MAIARKSQPVTATESLTKKAAPRRKTAATEKKTTTSRARNASTAALASDAPKSQEVELLAYKLWEERGCPEGTSVEDWNRAQEMLLQSH